MNKKQNNKNIQYRKIIQKLACFFLAGCSLQQIYTTFIYMGVFIMKRNILSLLMVTVFALTVAMGFIGCKKADAPQEGAAVEQPADEAPAAEEAAE